MISTNLLYQVVASHNKTSIDTSCYILPINTLLQELILIFMALRDILSLGLMSFSSGYMVLILHQHKRQVKHLHSPSQAPETSAERRAIQTILLLVSCFVVFYCGDLVFSLLLGASMKKNATFLNASMFVVSGYATVSPFVFLNCDTRVIKFLRKSLSTFVPLFPPLQNGHSVSFLPPT
uniref:Vomeronasal type-1 receptor n=1 Tax=Ornithorhynchus anatinus TaxID=9258 RepID=F6Y4M8_ORNAN